MFGEARNSTLRPRRARRLTSDSSTFSGRRSASTAEFGGRVLDAERPTIGGGDFPQTGPLVLEVHHHRFNRLECASPEHLGAVTGWFPISKRHTLEGATLESAFDRGEPLSAHSTARATVTDAPVNTDLHQTGSAPSPTMNEKKVPVRAWK